MFGATGKFPQGKINPSDEGELSFGIGADQKNNVVVLVFGKEVKWMGMPPDVARQMAAKLVEKADELKGEAKKPFGKPDDSEPKASCEDCAGTGELPNGDPCGCHS
jgi:hypothetical protein